MLKKNLVFLLSLTVVLVFILLNSNITIAQTTGGVNPNQPTTGSAGSDTKPVQTMSKLVNPLKLKFSGSIEQLVFSLADIAIFIGTIVAVFVFIYIGFKFVMAQGSESEINEAKSWFLYAVIGTAVLISSKVIVEIMKNTLVSAGIVDRALFNQ